MNLFLPDKDSLKHFLLSEDQINDLQFLSDKLKLHSDNFHVFILGGTGSGKSTLLNCIANQPLAKAGVQRPTTTELTLYGDLNNFEIPEGSIKCFSPKHDDSSIFSSIILWDFPDLDSYHIDNHKWTYLFRNYADCILLVVHPEKTKQATLINLLKEYPGIPHVLILTHKDQYVPSELKTVIADLKLTYQRVISLDSVSDAENSRARIQEYFESVKEEGLQEFKSRNLLELVNHCESALNVYKSSLDNKVSETNLLLNETNELLETSFQIISSAIFQVFQEKIFEEVQMDLLSRLYKTTPGWSILILECFQSLNRKGSTQKAIPYQALPFYSFQKRSQVFSHSESIFNKFCRDHMDIILESQQRLRIQAQQHSILQWSQALIIEVLFPVWLVFQVVNNLSVGGLSLGLSLLTVLTVLIICFCIGFLRLRYRLKSCYNFVFKIYQEELQKWFKKVLTEELDRLNSESQDQRRSLESVNAILQLTHTGS